MAVNPLEAFAQGQGLVNSFTTQLGQRQAGRALAQGDYASAMSSLFNSGDVDGGLQLQRLQQQQQELQRSRQDEQRKRQVQFTMQATKALRGAVQEGQDPIAVYDSFQPAFQALGVAPEELGQYRQALAANPAAFLDTVEQAVGQAARELEIQNLGNGYGVAIDKATGQVVNEYQAPQRPMNVGNVLIDPETREVILDAREPRYQTIQNTDGSTSVVAIDQPAPRSGGSTSSGSGVPRGMRNNNPGNIEDGPFARSLPGYAGSDGRFAIFSDLASGEGAQARLLQSYVQRGFDTPAEIINRWAPPSDNNPTNAYVNYVARRVGVGPNDRISAEQIPLVAQAIREFENGGQSASNGRPAAATSSGGTRVVAQGQNRGLSPSEQRAVAREERAEQREQQREQASLRRDAVGLRREFNNRAEVKAFTGVQAAYRGLEAAATGPATSGSDLSLIFQFMKILDPTSVVREGEFATAQNSGSAYERVGNLYNRVLNGTRLNARQRADFLQQGRSLYRASEQGFRPVLEQYRGYAEAQGINPDDVAPVPRGQQSGRQQPRTNAPGLRFNITESQLQTRQRLIQQGASPSAPLGSTRNPRYLNPADPSTSYGNIPRGQHYVSPDGQIREKR